MSRAYASTVIPAPVETVWAFARDFGNLAEWIPIIASCTLLDGATGSTVGGIRHLVTTDGDDIRERLLQLNEVDRSYSYCFTQSPFPVRSYVATIRFSPITDTGQTFAEWWADFDTDAENEAELLESFALRERYISG
jgi:hypothetical protein